MTINYKWALLALMLIVNNEVVSWLILLALAIPFVYKLLKGAYELDNRT